MKAKFLRTQLLLDGPAEDVRIMHKEHSYHQHPEKSFGVRERIKKKIARDALSGTILACIIRIFLTLFF